MDFPFAARPNEGQPGSHGCSKERKTMSGTTLTRRSFLKTTGAVAGASCLGAGSFGALRAFADDQDEKPGEGEQLFNCNCRSNCMGSCRLLAHVRDGKLVKLSPGGYQEPGYTGCCLKGLSYVERIYSPTRIQYPMRRVDGTERGAGQWERVTWDEAIAEIAQKMQDTIDQYGPKAIAFDAASGNYGYINGVYGLFPRLAACLGAIKTAACYDYAAGHGIDRVLGTGDWQYCNEPNSVLDSSMVVVWGTNPVFTHPHSWRWIQWAKEKGTKVVTIDPIKSATAHRSDEYIRVNPGHDGYLALAMANYVIEHDLVDDAFIADRSNAAFLVRQDTKRHLSTANWPAESAATYAATVAAAKEKYAAQGPTAVAAAVAAIPVDYYVWENATGSIVLLDDAADPAMEGSFATPDGIALDTSYSLLKEQLSQYSIAEAARLTGLTEDFIVEFTERFAAEDAVSVNITYGLDHYLNGYHNTWAIAILMALTGNLAKPGAGFTGVFTTRWSPETLGLWVTKEYKGLNATIPFGLMPEIVATQSLNGKPFPMKVMVSYCANPASNLGGQREFLDRLLPNLDYYVVIDMEMTDSAQYADMVLPATSWYEVEDIRAGYNNPYTIFQEKAIEPLYESKPDSEIAYLLGRALGFEASFPEGDDIDTWGAILFSNAASKAKGLTLDRFRQEKVIQTTGTPGESFITGMTSPFTTEKGRVRLYTDNPQPRLNYGQDLSDRVDGEHLVYYRDPAEAGVDSPLAEKYPLVYLQEHSRFRVHTQWGRVPLLRELDPEPLAKVNGKDAADRGVTTGDLVEVYNDRGRCVVKCLIDESIAPGVVSIPKGWQRDQFIEGGYQEMSQPGMDPYPSAASFYDARVNFRKWEA